jgi:hypothetical protein
MVDGAPMTRLVALLCVAGLAHAGDDPLAALERATRGVLVSTRKIPNYTCVETVERRYYQPMGATLKRACSVILEQRKHPTLDLQLHLESTDRLRFDVAMLTRGEMFSWVGASKFEDEGIVRLVHSGPIATGAFGSFLTLVFGQDVKQFQFLRGVPESGRGLLEFGFDVPAADSHYRIQLGDRQWANASYGGTVQIDPQLDRVVRMNVNTRELPEAAGSCMTISALEYAMTRIGEAEFLLAASGRQRFVAPDGREIENTTTFSNCREYLGESTIQYDTVEPRAAGRARAAPDKPRMFTPGLRFELKLEHAIDSTTAAAGDPFEARLVSALRDPSRGLSAPAGSLVRGRILRVEAFHVKPLQTIVVLRPETVLVGDTEIAIPSVRVLPNPARGKGVAVELPLPGESRAGVFRFDGEHAVVPVSLRSEWRTVFP